MAHHGSASRDSPENGSSQQGSHGLRHFVDGVIDFAGGTAGGIASVYVGQPLDTIKVKMQTFPDIYRNSLKCFRETLQNEGIRRGLYAGTVPALAANIGENSVLFAAYGGCQKVVASAFGVVEVGSLHPIHNALAGSLAAVFSTFTLCPTELIKCKLQALREMQAIETAKTGVANTAPRMGPWTLTRHIIRTEGILGMFRGFWPTFAREVPGYFFFFGGYETTRTLLTPAGTKKEDIGTLKTLFCGGMGGVCLWTAIFPADVVKSRVQIQGKGSLLPLLLEILRTEVEGLHARRDSLFQFARGLGFRALYKGLGPTVIRTFFGTGALFVAYENTKRILHTAADPFI